MLRGVGVEPNGLERVSPGALLDPVDHLGPPRIVSHSFTAQANDDKTDKRLRQLAFSY